ncbi:MAG: hypothetical protein IJ678_00960, partial [Kiritimatiellae bacterium]|nr:hypothetical protein [Kiritimatiellia bacterium]
MARTDWNLKTRSRECIACSRPFADGEWVHSCVVLSGSPLFARLFPPQPEGDGAAAPAAAAPDAKPAA